MRLDKLVVERGLTSSRERAQALVLAGKVLVNGQRIEKAGAGVDTEAELRLIGEELKYVSRGGLKLERALDYWNINPTGRLCLDIGVSTGGFTDCLLQHGAARVIGVDTGRGQIDFRLRTNPRVHLLENTNARHLTHQQLGEFVDLVAIDVSFISATLILPAVVAAGFPESSSERKGRKIVVLIKPQFEVGREQVGKGGIVADPRAQTAAFEKVRHALTAMHCRDTDVIDSPILGKEGNREFLLYGIF